MFRFRPSMFKLRATILNFRRRCSLSDFRRVRTQTNKCRNRLNNNSLVDFDFSTFGSKLILDHFNFQISWLGFDVQFSTFDARFSILRSSFCRFLDLALLRCMFFDVRFSYFQVFHVGVSICRFSTFDCFTFDFKSSSFDFDH